MPPKRVVIIGAGGHAREVADLMRTQSATEVLGFIDDNQLLHGNQIDGLSVLGDWTWFAGVDLAHITTVCAVGTPEISRRLVRRARDLGLSFAHVISPLASVSPYAKLGTGIAVFPNAVINAGAIIGSHSIVNVAATISHDSTIGSYTNLNPGAHLAGNVKVGKGCYVGMGANVIQGRSIGAWSVVGAGACVTTDLPANVTAVGVPARIIKTREEGWYDK
jgi:sugar O-acyltransferase (sialic acid O-acetyltransferase NeuD family)